MIADAHHIRMEAGGQETRRPAVRGRVRGATLLLVMALLGCGASSASDPTDPRPSRPIGAQRVLPEGLRVPAGATLQGPVLVQRYTRGGLSSRTAVMSVTGNPQRVWRSLARQLSRRFPREPIKAGEVPGCELEAQHGFGCGLELEARHPAIKETLAASVSLAQPRGDITGRYILTVATLRHPTPGGRTYPRRKPPLWTRGAFPAPKPAPPAPRVGDPLPPTVTEAGVLLPGSAMITPWGTGSITGGFDVLLKVLPGADAEDIGAAYARQGAQGEGKTRVTRSREGDDLIIDFVPPGGAGGYQANIHVIDRPGDEDYIYYTFYND